MSYTQHHHDADAIGPVRCAVITLSDSRTPDTDLSGKAIRDGLTSEGHVVASYDLIRDEPNQLQTLLDTLLPRGDIDAILTTGGTGIARRDNTISVVERALTTVIPGFGELFRMLSYQSIGSGSLLSRAIAGIVNTADRRTLVVSMPGSTDAVTLAMSKLILPELKHLVWTLRN
jgi:molybdenum cofactor biosynthesis protein B